MLFSYKEYRNKNAKLSSMGEDYDLNPARTPRIHLALRFPCFPRTVLLLGATLREHSLPLGKYFLRKIIGARGIPYFFHLGMRCAMCLLRVCGPQHFELCCQGLNFLYSLFLFWEIFQGSTFSEKLQNKIAHMQTILPIFSVFVSGFH